MTDSAALFPKTESIPQGLGKFIPLPKTLNRNSLIAALLLALVSTVAICMIETLKTRVLGGNPATTTANDQTTSNTLSASKGRFDASAFLKQTQVTMKARAKTLAETHASDLARNIAGYSEEMEQATKTIEQRVSREKNEERIKELIETSKSSQNRLPEKLTGRLALLPVYNKIHDKFLDRQKSINTTFDGGISDLSASYISEIKKQIPSTKDETAARFLEKEVSLVDGSKDYFRQMILPKGSSPANQ